MIIYNSMYFPLEIIYSFDENPCYVNTEIETLQDAEVEEILRFMNPYYRNMFVSLKQKEGIMLLAQTDCHSIRMTEFLKQKKSKIISVNVPAAYKEKEAFEYYRKELEQVIEQLEAAFSAKLCHEKLCLNIIKVNKIRQLLREIDQIRKNPEYQLNASCFFEILQNSMSGNLDNIICNLENVRNKIKGSDKGVVQECPKILVITRGFHSNSIEFIKIIEKTGAKVIHELVDEGRWEFERDLDIQEEVLDDLVEYYYLKKFPPNYYHSSWKQRYEYIKEVVVKYQIDGVIIKQLAFDEIYDMEYSSMTRKLSKDGIPFLRLESSKEDKDELASIETRIESFVAMLMQERLW